MGVLTEVVDVEHPALGVVWEEMPPLIPLALAR